jgi:hypothetical protein
VLYQTHFFWINTLKTMNMDEAIVTTVIGLLMVVMVAIITMRLTTNGCIDHDYTTCPPCNLKMKTPARTPVPDPAAGPHHIPSQNI